VIDLLELEGEGVDVEPMRVLLRENRVISSIAADLDQKACWEVLTDPRLCQQYFTPEDRQLFQRHILWTRVLSDRRTVLPDGRQGNLLEYARSSHEALVLKPNRSYGGDGIVILPGGGVRKVPPNSPLAAILEHVAAFESGASVTSLGLQQQVRREALGQMITMATHQLEAMAEIRAPALALRVAETQIVDE